MGKNWEKKGERGQYAVAGLPEGLNFNCKCTLIGFIRDVHHKEPCDVDTSEM